MIFFYIGFGAKKSLLWGKLLSNLKPKIGYICPGDVLPNKRSKKTHDFSILGILRLAKPLISQLFQLIILDIFPKPVFFPGKEKKQKQPQNRGVLFLGKNQLIGNFVTKCKIGRGEFWKKKSSKKKIIFGHIGVYLLGKKIPVGGKLCQLIQCLDILAPGRFLPGEKVQKHHNMILAIMYLVGKNSRARNFVLIQYWFFGPKDGVFPKEKVGKAPHDLWTYWCIWGVLKNPGLANFVI